ncbi:MAG TPA: hypothetical protein VD835_12910 [Pyrinomonadaceae bacterium]|nr:hypothetical protein [Pyrinomonadaceae bacterium]
MIRSKIVLTFTLLTWSCMPESGERPQALPSPEVVSAVKPQTTAGTDSECENVSKVLGYAVLHFDGTTAVPLFAKPDSSGQPVQVIRFYDNPATNSTDFRVEGEGIYAQLRPKGMKVDYGVFHLSVLSRRGGWLEVVDEETGTTRWLQENKTVEFRNWLKYMQESFAVGAHGSDGNPLRLKPADDAKEVKMIGSGCFKVEEMRGDWIKVVQQPHCEEVKVVTPATGWLRWRDKGGCMLVSIYPFA